MSAITVAKNEEDWAETSIRSILPHVDELLVADDQSEDGTATILQQVSLAFPAKVRFIHFPKEDFVGSTNALICATRYRWILRWHADFVARTKGPESVPALLRAAQDLSPLRHACVAISGVVLDGDMEHQFADRRDRPEPFLFSYSPWIRYLVRDRWESLSVPWFYEKLSWASAPYFHMRSVKSPERLLQKLYWSRWFEAKNNGSTESLKSFIHRHAIDEFQVATWEDAARIHVIQEFQGCKPFSRDLCGEYPEALLPFLRRPKYRLIVEDGHVVGRLDLKQSSQVEEE